MVTAIINKFIDKLRGNDPNSSKDSDGLSHTSKDQKKPDVNPKNIDLVAFVDYVVRSLVEFPDEVLIETEKDDRGLVMKVSCKKSEIRKIIGKNGKTINAIRALVKGAARRLDQNATVVVID